ncbi:hypothetical protein RB597_008528 [Gaeumannomyces tritici]
MVLIASTPNPSASPPRTRKFRSFRENYSKLDSFPASSPPGPSQPAQRTSPAHRAPSLAREIAEELVKTGVGPGTLTEQSILLQLSLHPIRVICSEWAMYSLLMGRYVKLFEYSTKSLQKKISDITDINHPEHPIKLLNSWRRRGQLGAARTKAIKWFLEQHQPRAEDGKDLRKKWDALTQDVDHVARQIGEYRGVLEGMVPTLTMAIQLEDAKRAAEEALHVKQLTLVALVFLPLSYVCGLFSMSEYFSVQGGRAWLYWAASVPLLVFVLLLSLSWVRPMCVRIWRSTRKVFFGPGKKERGN